MACSRCLLFAVCLYGLLSVAMTHPIPRKLHEYSDYKSSEVLSSTIRSTMITELKKPAAATKYCMVLIA